MKRKQHPWLSVIGAIFVLGIAAGFCGIVLATPPETSKNLEPDFNMTATVTDATVTDATVPATDPVP